MGKNPLGAARNKQKPKGRKFGITMTLFRLLPLGSGKVNEKV